jgi:two-component system, chemotaxis family, response regulator Rcp1
VTVPVEQEPIEILLVEDSVGDVHLTREALREAAVPHRLHIARDGVEAMAYLRRAGRCDDEPLPGLILLDLNLPRKDGREVLAEIKRDPAFRRVPVIILTTSSAAADVTRSYDLHANCYLVKPLDIAEFFEEVRAIDAFWLRLVKLPAQMKEGAGP